MENGYFLVLNYFNKLLSLIDKMKINVSKQHYYKHLQICMINKICN